MADPSGLGDPRPWFKSAFAHIMQTIGDTDESIHHHDTAREAFIALRRAADLPPGGGEFTKAEIQSIAETLRVDTTGTKAEVANRLLPDGSIGGGQLRKWQASAIVHRIQHDNLP